MDLLEYQAKELFKEVGIPILPSQTIHHTSELKRLQMPYPLVLKSQVRTGGRGKAGGVRFVENTIDAIAVSTAIFHLSIAGEYPEVILAEARYDSQQEFFLAIVLDYQRQRPVLLGSSQGGIDVDALLQEMQSVSLTEPFSPFYARRLAIQMGLTGPLVPAVSEIIEKMYQLFIRYDLDLIEINPLGIRQGEVMALDGKIAVNDQAITRHGDLCSLVEINSAAAIPRWIKGDPTAQVGMISNSYGLTLSSWDVLQESSLSVMGAYILDDDNGDHSLTEQINQALIAFSQSETLAAVLINILTSPDSADAVATCLAQYFPEPTSPLGEDRLIRATAANTPQRERWSSRTAHRTTPLPVVIRLSQGDLTAYAEQCRHLPVYWFNALDQAIAKLVALFPLTQDY